MSNLSNVAFLVLAVIVSGVGSLIVVARHRKPSSLTTSIDDFSERMQALAPEQRRADPTGPRPSSGDTTIAPTSDVDADSDSGSQ